MKKFLVITIMILVALTFSGCSGKDLPKLELSDPNEKVWTEAITWENVLTERWP